MSSTFNSIQTGLMAALAANPALAGGHITANRLRPISASHSTAIVVRLDKTAGQEIVLGAMDWTTSYTVECYARAAGGADPGAAVDQLLVDAWARLCAIDAASIGAIDITMTPAIDWQYDDADTPMVCALIRLAVQHRTLTTAI